MGRATRTGSREIRWWRVVEVFVLILLICIAYQHYTELHWSVNLAVGFLIGHFTTRWTKNYWFPLVEPDIEPWPDATEGKRWLNEDDIK